MPLLTRKRTILAKIEAAYGTDPVPTGAANAILVRNLNVTPISAEFHPRELVRPYLGNYENLPGAFFAQVEFEVENVGSGAAGTAPKFGPVLRAAGLSETIVAATSVTYAPISTFPDSVTVYFNIDGVLHKLTGARGSVALDFTVKNIPVLRFKLIGIYNTVADVAAPVVDYSGFKTPALVNNVNTTPLTVFGYAAVASSIRMDVMHTVTPRALIGGSQQILITDRKSTAEVAVEAAAVAAKDWWSTIKAGTLGALTATHGTLAGYKVQINANQAQILQPAYEDLDGIQMLRLPFVLTPTSNGNDEFNIVYT